MCSADIRAEIISRRLVRLSGPGYGMMSSWLRSSRSLSVFSPTLPGSPFFYSGRRGRSKPRICFFADNWHYSKSAESSRGV